MRNWMTGCALTLVTVLGGATLAVAQDAPDRTRLHLHPPLRIFVTPRGQLFRQCLDRPVIEHRATGDTVVPSFHCWWAVR
jgi:hypothetical protein